MNTCPTLVKLGDLLQKTNVQTPYDIQYADRAMPGYEPVKFVM